jgi:hypothetical protein
MLPGTFRLSPRSAALALAAALLSTLNCMPPLMFHESLPAWIPTTPVPEIRIGVHRGYGAGLSDNVYFDPGLLPYYLNPGVRVGRQIGRFTFEAGINSVIVPEVKLFLVGPSVGIGLTDPCAAARFSCLLAVDGDKLVPCPQWSWLFGTPRKTAGLNLAAGVMAGVLGIGPVAVAEYCLKPVAIRGEASIALPPPWMLPIVQGVTGTAGLSVAAPVLENRSTARLSPALDRPRTARAVF